MKNVGFKIIFLFTLVFGFSSQAQSKKWTLKECVDYALKNNISIKQSELDLKISDVEKMEAVGKYIKNISFVCKLSI